MQAASARRKLKPKSAHSQIPSAALGKYAVISHSLIWLPKQLWHLRVLVPVPGAPQRLVGALRMLRGSHKLRPNLQVLLWVQAPQTLCTSISLVSIAYLVAVAKAAHIISATRMSPSQLRNERHACHCLSERRKPLLVIEEACSGLQVLR